MNPRAVRRRPAARAPRVAGLILGAGDLTGAPVPDPRGPTPGGITIEHAAKTLLGAGLGPVVVATGERPHDGLWSLASRLGLVVAPITPAHGGPLEALQAGLAALPSYVRACAVLPGDQAAVRPHTARRLAERFTRLDVDVLHPVFEGRRGHPRVLSARLFPAIHGAPRDAGLHEVLERAGVRHRELPVFDEGVLREAGPGERLPAGHDAAREVPTARECAALLERAGTPSAAVRHGRAVADVAVRLGAGLRDLGHTIDVGLVGAGALLHDIAYGRVAHARVGAGFLRRLGHHKVARIVEGQEDLESGVALRVNERTLVFLAHALVYGDRAVGLEERLARELARAGLGRAAHERLHAEHRAALAAATAVEGALGSRLQAWLPPVRRSGR